MRYSSDVPFHISMLFVQAIEISKRYVAKIPEERSIIIFFKRSLDISPFVLGFL